MKLTTKSEYALLALIYVARHRAEGFAKAEAIRAAYELSKKYLEQILASLKQARYIKTRRGAAGGYMLAKPARQISVAEVIRLMDGALAPTLAASKHFYAHTPLEKEKKIMDVFREIREYMSRRVERLTIADLV